MMIIGLTGPSGAGKGTVALRFAAYGIPSIDTDKLYHELLIPPSACLHELTARFGSDILKPDGTLDRPALSSMVFAPDHKEDLADLNRITHRYVLERVRHICRELAKTDCPAVLVDAPLLFESGFDKECDIILAVTTDRDIRLARIMARDGLDEATALTRMAAQASDDAYTTRAHAVIHNQGDPADMDEDIRRLLNEWGICHETN